MSTSPDLALANIGIVITRPVNQAKKLTQLIQTAGGNVIPFPLIEIAPLDDYTAFERVIEKIDITDWILFISSNAVQNSMPRLITKGIPSSLRFAAIGPATSERLAHFGVSNVLIPNGRFDSESLLLLPEMHAVNGQRVMIVRGVGGRDILANTLQSRGAKIIFAECYRRINPQTNCDALTKAYAKNQLQSIIVTSSEAMRYLLALANSATWLKEVTVCVNHARIAEEALTMGLKVIVASQPGDEAMMDLLLKNSLKLTE